MNKVKKAIGIVAASLAALVVILLLFAGPIGKRVIQRHDQQIVGRQIEMQRLKLNLLSGNLRIYGFAIKEEDGQSDFVTFDTLDVSVRLLKLLRSELHIPHITLAGPHVQIIQDDSIFNFSDIIEKFSSEEKDTTPSDWKIRLYNIRLADGRIRYRDEKLDKEWSLNNLHIKVPGVYLDGENNTDAGVSLSFAEHGSLQTKVQYNMGDNNFAINLKINRFALQNLTPYLAGAMAVEIPKGDFSGDFRISGNLDDILNMDIQGQCAIRNLKINDLNQQEVAMLHKLDVGISHINPQQNRYEFDHITIDSLSSHFDLFADGSNNFTRLMVKQEEPAETAPAETAPEAAADTTPPAPFHLQLKSLQVDHTNLNINDYSLTDPFRFPITRIRVTAEDISTEGKNRLKMLAGLPDGGFAHLQWNGTLGDVKEYQNIVINIKNLKMSQLSPYVVHYVGYPLTDGTFSFTSENNIRNAQLQGDNKVDIYKLTVGDKRDDVKPETNIPLKAAVYVLNDKDDKILLDIPVSGDLNNPEFSYMKIVWKTLTNLLVKVSVSPLRYMADAVGLNGDQLEQMKIDPLQFDFTSEQYDFLSQLTKLAQMDTNILIRMEQQLDWEAAAHQLSLYNVKRDYYLLQHPEKKDYRLQLTDFDKINAISIKELDFLTYLNDRVGEASEKKSVTEKAEQLYPVASMRKELAAMAERRNQYIRYYMVKQSGLSARQLEISTSETNQAENRYQIDSQLREGIENMSFNE